MEGVDGYKIHLLQVAYTTHTMHYAPAAGSIHYIHHIIIVFRPSSSAHLTQSSSAVEAFAPGCFPCAISRSFVCHRRWHC
jgi:hypothetical protein